MRYECQMGSAILWLERVWRSMDPVGEQGGLIPTACQRMGGSKWRSAHFYATNCLQAGRNNQRNRANYIMQTGRRLYPRDVSKTPSDSI